MRDFQSSEADVSFLTSDPATWWNNQKSADTKLMTLIFKGKKPVKTHMGGFFGKPYNFENRIQSFLSSLEMLRKLPPDSLADFSPQLAALSLICHLIDGRAKGLAPNIYFRLRDIKHDLFYNVCGYVDVLTVDDIQAISPNMRNDIYQVIYHSFSQTMLQYDALRKKVHQYERNIDDEKRAEITQQLLDELDNIAIPHSLIKVMRTIEKTPYCTLACVSMRSQLSHMEKIQIQSVELRIRINNIRLKKSPYEPLVNLTLSTHLSYLQMALEETEEIVFSRIDKLVKEKIQLTEVEKQQLVDRRNALIEKRHAAIIVKLYRYANQGRSTWLEKLVGFFVNPIVNASGKKMLPEAPLKNPRSELIDETIQRLERLKKAIVQSRSRLVHIENPAELPALKQQVDTVIQCIDHLHDPTLRDAGVRLEQYQVKNKLFHTRDQMVLEISKQDRYLWYPPEKCIRGFTKSQGEFFEHLATRIEKALHRAYIEIIKIPGVLESQKLVLDKNHINQALTIFESIVANVPYAGSFLSGLVRAAQDHYDELRQLQLLTYFQQLANFRLKELGLIAEAVATHLTNAQGFLTEAALADPMKAASLVASKIFVRYYAALLDGKETIFSDHVSADSRKIQLIQSLANSVLVYSPPEESSFSQRVNTFLYGIQESDDKEHSFPTAPFHYIQQEPAAVLKHLTEKTRETLLAEMDKLSPTPPWVIVYHRYLKSENNREQAFLHTINHYRRLCELPPLAELEQQALQQAQHEKEIARQKRESSFKERVEQAIKQMKMSLVNLGEQLAKAEQWTPLKQQIELELAPLLQAEKLQKENGAFSHNVQVQAALSLLAYIQQTEFSAHGSLETLLQKCLMPKTSAVLGGQGRSPQKTAARERLVAALRRVHELVPTGPSMHRPPLETLAGS